MIMNICQATGFVRTKSSVTGLGSQLFSSNTQILIQGILVWELCSVPLVSFGAQNSLNSLLANAQEEFTLSMQVYKRSLVVLLRFSGPLTIESLPLTTLKVKVIWQTSFTLTKVSVQMECVYGSLMMRNSSAKLLSQLLI